MVLLNKIYYKHCWLLGQKVQLSLFKREGVEIPHPDDLRSEFKTTAEMLNYRQSKFGCKFDWESTLFVIYQGESFNIFEEIKQIIKECIIGTLSDAVGFDVRGLDFPKACNLANSRIIEKIVNGEHSSSETK
ncbi:MAG: hypothetical protein ACTSO9_08235 [Candidatus Helarchaeota archaeon]